MALSNGRTPAWFCPVLSRALRTFDNAILLGAVRIVPNHLQVQTQQPQRQGGRQIAPRTPRAAVVHPQRLRLSPAPPGLPQLLLHRLRWHPVEEAVGGKR